VTRKFPGGGKKGAFWGGVFSQIGNASLFKKGGGLIDRLRTREPPQKKTKEMGDDRKQETISISNKKVVMLTMRKKKNVIRRQGAG